MLRIKVYITRENTGYLSRTASFQTSYIKDFLVLLPMISKLVSGKAIPFPSRRIQTAGYFLYSWVQNTNLRMNIKRTNHKMIFFCYLIVPMPSISLATWTPTTPVPVSTSLPREKSYELWRTSLYHLTMQERYSYRISWRRTILDQMGDHWILELFSFRKIFQQLKFGISFRYLRYQFCLFLFLFGYFFLVFELLFTMVCLFRLFIWFIAQISRWLLDNSFSLICWGYLLFIDIKFITSTFIDCDCDILTHYSSGLPRLPVHLFKLKRAANGSFNIIVYFVCSFWILTIFSVFGFLFLAVSSIYSFSHTILRILLSFHARFLFSLRGRMSFMMYIFIYALTSSFLFCHFIEVLPTFFFSFH